MHDMMGTTISGYKSISHSDRLNVIYNFQVHNLRKSTIATMLNIHYSSAQSIIRAFETTGRTNKKKYHLANYLMSKGMQNQRQSDKVRRGRKMLSIDMHQMLDAFGELNRGKSSNLKLYVDQETD